MSTSKTRGPDETPEVIAAARAHSHDRAHPHEHAGGRGGAGNMTHEPDAGSRERQKIAEEEEHKVQAEYHERHKNDAHHSGRGGMGSALRSHHLYRSLAHLFRPRRHLVVHSPVSNQLPTSLLGYLDSTHTTTLPNPIPSLLWSFAST